MKLPLQQNAELRPAPAPENLPQLETRMRSANAAHRADAFDNIDVDKLLASSPLALPQIEWLSRHLIANSRQADGFLRRAGDFARSEDFAEARGNRSIGKRIILGLLLQAL